MTFYRGTLCGFAECQAPATVVLALLVPPHGVPFDAKRPLEILAASEACAAHADHKHFALVLKRGKIVERVQAVLQAQRMPPLDMRKAVVRRIAKTDIDQPQYAS